MNAVTAFFAATEVPSPALVLGALIALMLISVGLLIFLLKTVTELRSEVAELRRRPALPPVTPPEPANASRSQSGIEPDAPTLALISAAVFEVTAGRRHRIAAVTPARPEPSGFPEASRQTLPALQVR